MTATHVSPHRAPHANGLMPPGVVPLPSLILTASRAIRTQITAITNACAPVWIKKVFRLAPRSRISVKLHRAGAPASDGGRRAEWKRWLTRSPDLLPAGVFGSDRFLHHRLVGWHGSGQRRRSPKTPSSARRVDSARPGGCDSTRLSAFALHPDGGCLRSRRVATPSVRRGVKRTAASSSQGGGSPQSDLSIGTGTGKCQRAHFVRFDPNFLVGR